jgi:hypothetical protein
VVEDLAVPVDTTGEPAGTGRVFAAFRRWGAGSGGRVALSFSVFDELYGPNRHQARIEVEEQRRVGRPAPSPTGPPELPELGPATPDRLRERFQGTVVVRAQPRRGTGTSQSPPGHRSHGSGTR